LFNFFFFSIVVCYCGNKLLFPFSYFYYYMYYHLLLRGHIYYCYSHQCGKLITIKYIYIVYQFPLVTFCNFKLVYNKNWLITKTVSELVFCRLRVPTNVMTFLRMSASSLVHVSVNLSHKLLKFLYVSSHEVFGLYVRPPASPVVRERLPRSSGSLVTRWSYQFMHHVVLSLVRAFFFFSFRV
jgi:hypothetical protein